MEGSYSVLMDDPQHWFVHRYVCKKGLAGDPVMDDDGDPDWDTLPDEYDTHYYEDLVGSGSSRTWSQYENAEIFIDIPHPSHFRKGEVFRIRTTTLSPVMLRYIKWYWGCARYLWSKELVKVVRATGLSLCSQS